MKNWTRDIQEKYKGKPWYPWLVLVFLAGGAVSVNADSSMVSVALPAIQDSWGI